jgi:hypothetical protein
MSNAAICRRCYPLLVGARSMCREHLLENAVRPFVEASKRYEENSGDFVEAFQSISIADIRRAAAIELGPEQTE